MPEQILVDSQRQKPQRWYSCRKLQLIIGTKTHRTARVKLIIVPEWPQKSNCGLVAAMSRTSCYSTLVYTDSYIPGALVLGNRLAVLDERPRIALVTAQVSEAARDELSKVWRVKEVDPLFSGNSEELQLLGRPELDTSVTKIWVWTLPYTQVVYLDADTLPLKPLTDLDKPLELSEIAASPDIGWPDIFNSGVFACRPDKAVFEDLKDLIRSSPSFDGSDQGLLNEYFANSWKRLPFVYNVTLSASYQYEPAYRRFKKDIRVLHFIGSKKPWVSGSEFGPSIAANEMLYEWKRAALAAGVFKQELPPEAERATTDYDPKRIVHPDPRRWEGDRFAPMRGGNPEARKWPPRPQTPGPGSPVPSDDELDEGSAEPAAGQSAPSHHHPHNHRHHHSHNHRHHHNDNHFVYQDEFAVSDENVYVFPILGPEVVQLPFERRQQPAERVFY